MVIWALVSTAAESQGSCGRLEVASGPERGLIASPLAPQLRDPVFRLEPQPVSDAVGTLISGKHQWHPMWLDLTRAVTEIRHSVGFLILGKC